MNKTAILKAALLAAAICYPSPSLPETPEQTPGDVIQTCRLNALNRFLAFDHEAAEKKITWAIGQMNTSAVRAQYARAEQELSGKYYDAEKFTVLSVLAENSRSVLNMLAREVKEEQKLKTASIEDNVTSNAAEILGHTIIITFPQPRVMLFADRYKVAEIKGVMLHYFPHREDIFAPGESLQKAMLETFEWQMDFLQSKPLGHTINDIGFTGATSILASDLMYSGEILHLINDHVFSRKKSQDRFTDEISTMAQGIFDCGVSFNSRYARVSPPGQKPASLGYL